MGLIVPFAVYLFRQGLGASKASATGGVAVGLLTPILCCSPVLPIAISFVAGVFPSLVGSFGWGLQGFIATHQSELFLAAIVLLVLALYQNARRVQAGVACIAIHGTRSDAGGKRSPDSLDNA
jgi:fumarate reductase subunit D